MKLKVNYDQIPHVIRYHPLMTNDAESVFIALYKILKDKEKCVYSNEALCIAGRVSRKTLDKCLILLQKIGAIIKIGLKQNRKFHRGLLIISAHQSTTQALNADVDNKSPVSEQNTQAPNAHAQAPNAHAWAPNAHILRTTSKTSTTKTSVVVVISESKDKKLTETYVKHKDDLKCEDIQNVANMLDYCRWYLNKGKLQGIDEDGRFNQIIKFLIAGTLRIDPEWKNNLKLSKRRKSNKSVVDFQEYTTRIKSDINLGLIPADTHILCFEEWKKIHEKQQ